MLSNSNHHLFWLLQFIWTVFTISSPSSIIRQTTLIGSLLFFTAFQSRINTQPRLFMEWAFCMRCLCQGSVNSIVHTLCIFNQTTVTQQSVRRERKEKHMPNTIFYMSCHQKTLPINIRELCAKCVLLTQKSDQNWFTGLFLLVGEVKETPEASFPCLCLFPRKCHVICLGQCSWHLVDMSTADGYRKAVSLYFS